MNDLHASRDPVSPAFASGSSGPNLEPRAQSNGGSSSRTSPPTPRHSNAADLWPLVELLLRSWSWLLASVVLCGALAFACGLLFWRTSWTAPAQLIRYDSPSAAEVFGARQTAEQTLPSILHSPELIERVVSKASPPISASALAASVKVMPEHDSDIIVVTVTGRDREATKDLVNLYAREATRFTQGMQAKAANEVAQFATWQLSQVESEIAAENPSDLELPAAPMTAKVALSTSTLVARIEAARADLADLLGRYTEAHPFVRQKRAAIAALESEYASSTSAGNNGDNGHSPTNRFSFRQRDPELIRGRLQALETARLTLAARREAARSLAENPPGYCQVLAVATENDLVKHGRRTKAAFFAAFSGLLGFLGAAATILLIEVVDDRLKNAADVKRVAGLRVLAVAGDFEMMSAAQKESWAFRAWTCLQGRLSPSPNHGLVCGVTSSCRGEGRSTWISLLARTASQQGFRVLTITTRPATENSVPDRAAVGAGPGGATPDRLTVSGNVPAAGLDVLASPAEVAQKLMGEETEPIVHIPLPGWVWNLERRKHWHEALRHWSQIENVVILVELPPASEPEAVLLAENLPNVIWLAASGKAKAAETREQLETLRHARCRLAGAVLNRAPGSLLQRRFRRWLDLAAVSFALFVSTLYGAEETLQPAGGSGDRQAETNRPFALVSSRERAGWQRRLTLGPGDVVDCALFGEPTLTQVGVIIGPDGRLSYLEAQDVQATGLTVDELRERMDQELGKFRRAPQTIITPVAYRSKKYFLLGSVVQSGVFTLDRPITIVEAVARARGLQSALQDRNLVEVADLQRSFLIREGRRLPVDFERLFERGDLSQNAALAPDDYLYFPTADLKQVYIVGEVQTPGVTPWTEEMSALRAIAAQGGFTDRAWKKRVLVIRGSLDSPQATVVDAAAVLSARTMDFKLEPGDIVYVHRRPWVRAEEIVDLAATAFIQSAIIVWTGIHAGPLITSPIIR